MAGSCKVSTSTREVHMKKSTDHKVKMGEFLVTSEGLAFCLFPEPQSKTACGAIIRGEHEGFASEVIATSDTDEPVTTSDFLRINCCSVDLKMMQVRVHIAFRYTAPVVVRESAFIVPKSLNCGDFKFGDLRLIRGYRPLYEVFDED